jgi:hypothetical protein
MIECKPGIDAPPIRLETGNAARDHAALLQRALLDAIEHAQRFGDQTAAAELVEIARCIAQRRPDAGESDMGGQAR